MKKPDQTLLHFKDGINNIMGNATEQVYLDLFVFNNKALQFVLESCCNVKKLILRACEMHITSSFSIKLTKKYSIEDLNLFGTCDLNDKDYMTMDKLKIFVSTVSSSTLRMSLNTVRV